MSALTERLFALLHRNAASPTAYFGLPTDRVVSLGTMVDLSPRHPGPLERMTTKRI